ncbi:MAG TPA: SRPBCC family protein [Actinomycetota bacterium]|nr:SRPBCC family protein [Actinomycetota bacterium]
MKGWIALGGAAAAFAVAHHAGSRWGATDEDLVSPMPGDHLVADPKTRTMHAITIDAPPEAVWPWLVQMGYHRAGWYTYRWVDRYVWHIENPSADTVIDDLQALAVGDVVPDGEPGTAFYVVNEIDPPHSLVLRSTSHVPEPLRGRMRIDWTWAFSLTLDGDGRTRLRVAVRATYGPWWARPLMEGLVVPSDFVMARSMLRGVRRRAEGRPSRGDRSDAARRLAAVVAER